MIIGGKEVTITHSEYEPRKGGFTISWGSNIGFGELSFRKTEDGWTCDSESMGREFMQLVVNHWLNSVQLPGIDESEP